MTKHENDVIISLQLSLKFLDFGYMAAGALHNVYHTTG